MSDSVILGAGIHGFEKKGLAAHRELVAADGPGKQLDAAIAG